jgi:hypothetical protein
MGRLDENPKYWLTRAEETRTLAETLEDARSKEVLLLIAKDYERLARRAEDLAARRRSPT